MNTPVRLAGCVCRDPLNKEIAVVPYKPGAFGTTWLCIVIAHDDPRQVGLRREFETDELVNKWHPRNIKLPPACCSCHNTAEFQATDPYDDALGMPPCNAVEWWCETCYDSRKEEV